MKDSFGREIDYLRLSVTELCNLRCRYCMPEEGVCKKRHEDMLSEDEMIQVVEAAACLGIKKLRITGGEPLIKRNIVSICRRAALTEGINEVCLTTNGILLPQLAGPLREAGVKRLNISLDTLDPGKYAYITRMGSLADAVSGIEAAVSQGFDKIKINSVLIGGFNDDEIGALARLTLDRPIDVRFIELMPMCPGSGFGPEAYLPCDTVIRRLPELIPEGADGSARLYRLPGALGRIGLISPVSQHFCAGCNRIRVTADGKIKPCLHSHQELSLKGLSREEMCLRLKEAIRQKPAFHQPLSSESPSQAGRSMNQIGG